jgi:hypothetical protein
LAIGSTLLEMDVQLLEAGIHSFFLYILKAHITSKLKPEIGWFLQFSAITSFWCLLLRSTT